MGFGAAVGACMRKYGTFRGRARRSEFWWFFLFVQVATLPVVLIAGGFIVAEVNNASDSNGVVDPDLLNSELIGVLVGLVVVFSLVWWLPYLAVQVRRLHDAGQPGFWIVLHLVGLGIVPLALCALDGQLGTNQWGPDPREADHAPQPRGAR